MPQGRRSGQRTEGSSSLHQVLELIVDGIGDQSHSLRGGQVTECLVRLVERCQVPAQGRELFRHIGQVDLLGRDQGSRLALES